MLNVACPADDNGIILRYKTSGSNLARDFYVLPFYPLPEVMSDFRNFSMSRFGTMSKNWRGIHRIYRKKLRFNAYFNQNPILKNSKTEKMTKFHNKNHKKNQTWYKCIFARPLYSKCGYPKFVEFESIFMKRSKSILKICNTWFIIV